MQIPVKFYATSEQKKAFDYLVERDHGDMLENIAGVTEDHELTYQAVQKLIDHYCNGSLAEEERKYVFDFGYDMGVAQGILGEG